MMIDVKNISYKIGSKTILENINLSVSRGEFFGILGPNGSGKTTLLKLISGGQAGKEGEVIIDGRNIRMYQTKELAKKLAVLPQLNDAPFSFTVYDAIKIGRYAHQRTLLPAWSKEDEDSVQEAIRLTKIERLKDRFLDELSGGERQLVYLARALVQEAEILLLDEPTNHLDISHQINLLELLKELIEEKNLTVISIFHDLNLASLYCDKVLLLKDGKEVNTDTPRNLFINEKLEEIYDADLQMMEHPAVPKALITFNPSEKKNEQYDDSSIKVEEHSKEWIVLHTDRPYKSLSSAIIGSGFSWSTHFVTRFVDKNYYCDNPTEDMIDTLAGKGIDKNKTIGMMTAARLEDAVFKQFKGNEFQLTVMVTAGVSNAVDISQAFHYYKEEITYPGTINTWIFIEGHLTEAAFMQAAMTATEAKAKALQIEEVRDPRSGTVATGTSTDSIVIAATQTGLHFKYAGTITNIGKSIGLLVYEATVEAIQKNKKRLASLK
ncbi:adenosylcobinamide amidohydrolase [Metabacillus fastidiosus]|uniref:adenosylcobinamide amidohydrolase n=2 Tax=Metabacillus fastidiosus TaxID=1458 RepID=UPI003D2E683C